MEQLTLFVPAAYVAALVWAIGGDYLRAQLGKDLETDPPITVSSTLHAMSLPTICLIAALLLRLIFPVKGLLLSALFVAAAASVWKTYRVWILRPAGSVAGRPPVG